MKRLCRMSFILFSTAACAAAHPSVDAGSVSLNQPEGSGKTLIRNEGLELIDTVKLIQ